MASPSRDAAMEMIVVPGRFLGMPRHCAFAIAYSIPNGIGFRMIDGALLEKKNPSEEDVERAIGEVVDSVPNALFVYLLNRLLTEDELRREFARFGGLASHEDVVMVIRIYEAPAVVAEA